MISLLFWALAAFFDAVVDTNQFHYPVSIFTNYNPKFWDRSISSQGKKFLGVMVLDAWHIAKSLKMACFAIAIKAPKLEINWVIFFLVYAITWFIVFEIFWGKLLVKKNQQLK